MARIVPLVTLKGDSRVAFAGMINGEILLNQLLIVGNIIFFPYNAFPWNP